MKMKMKLTKRHLRKIIKEELGKIEEEGLLTEAPAWEMQLSNVLSGITRKDGYREKALRLTINYIGELLDLTNPPGVIADWADEALENYRQHTADAISTLKKQARKKELQGPGPGEPGFESPLPNRGGGIG